ncbi:MAG TPA: hypothetical protein VF814_19295 [Casimicrobiaceae bacterium]
MVSKLDHCLNDLLYRYKVGALKMEPVAIVWSAIIRVVFVPHCRY